MTYMLESLQKHLDGARAHTLYLLSGAHLADDELVAHQVSIDKAVANEFVSAYSDRIERTVDAEFMEYVPGYKPEDHQVQVMEVAEGSEVEETLSSITARLPNAALFRGDQATISKLKLSVFEISKAKDTAYIFRSYGPTRELSRGKWMALIQQKGKFDRVSDAILTFDPKIDFAYWQDRLYVFAAYDFARLLGDQPEAREKVRSILAEIDKRVPIENLEELVSACQGQVQMRLKVLALSEADYLANLSIAKIEQVAKTYKVPIRISSKDGKRRLVFEKDAARRFSILKLLEDAFVTGALTDRHYEANSKRRI